MIKFAAIGVELDYDYVNNVKCIKCFDSKEECEQFIINLEKDIGEKSLARNSYIKDYIKNVAIIPEWNQKKEFEEFKKEIEEFCKKYKYKRLSNTIEVSYHSFFRHLNGNKNLVLDDFNPPELSELHYYTSYHIVEIDL